MSENIAISPYDFHGHSVRTFIDGDGNPLFIAKDVAEALGYADTKKAIRDHCKRAKALKDMVVTGGNDHANQALGLDPKTKLIPESDTYRLAMRSTLEQAESFQTWLVEEVIPAIRRTGRYQLDAMPNFNDPIEAARAWLAIAERERDTLRNNTLMPHENLTGSKVGLKAIKDIARDEFHGMSSDRVHDWLIFDKHPRGDFTSVKGAVICNSFHAAGLEESFGRMLISVKRTVSSSKVSGMLRHGCFAGRRAIINRDTAIEYFGFCEEDFEDEENEVEAEE